MLLSFSSNYYMKMYQPPLFLVLRTYHIAVQSKCTIIHFEGLKANEFAYSTPSMYFRNSGHMKAVPAYAASICIHNPSLSPKMTKGVIRSRRSKANSHYNGKIIRTNNDLQNTTQKTKD